MSAQAVSALTTVLWIIIEAIQFGYMAYLMWRDKNVTDRNTFSSRLVTTCS